MNLCNRIYFRASQPQIEFLTSFYHRSNFTIAPSSINRFIHHIGDLYDDLGTNYQLFHYIIYVCTDHPHLAHGLWHLWFENHRHLTSTTTAIFQETLLALPPPAFHYFQTMSITPENGTPMMTQPALLSAAIPIGENSLVSPAKCYDATREEMKLEEGAVTAKTGMCIRSGRRRMGGSAKKCRIRDRENV